jgi:hypothetical protein
LRRRRTERKKKEAGLRKKFREKAREVVNEMKVYRAVDSAVKAGGFDPERVKERFSDDLADQLTRKRPRLMKAGGIDPEQHAIDSGYNNAEMLISDILDQPTKTEKVKEVEEWFWTEYEIGVAHENAAIMERVIDEEIRIVEEVTGTKPRKVKKKEIMDAVRRRQD